MGKHDIKRGIIHRSSEGGGKILMIKFINKFEIKSFYYNFDLITYCVMGTYQVLHVHNFNNCKGFYFINIYKGNNIR